MMPRDEKSGTLVRKWSVQSWSVKKDFWEYQWVRAGYKTIEPELEKMRCHFVVPKIEELPRNARCILPKVIRIDINKSSKAFSKGDGSVYLKVLPNGSNDRKILFIDILDDYKWRYARQRNDNSPSDIFPHTKPICARHRELIVAKYYGK